MAIADLKRNNVVYAGGIPLDYTVRKERAAKAAFLPGTIVFIDGDGFSPLESNLVSQLPLIADKAYLQAGHIGDEYAIGDFVTGIIPLPGMCFNLLSVAGDYTDGQALAIVNGKVTASQSNDGIFGFADETATVTDGGFIRVLIK